MGEHTVRIVRSTCRRARGALWRKEDTTRRRFLGVGLGLIAVAGIALLGTLVVEAAWPTQLARPRGSVAWYVGLLLSGMVHLGAGFAGGRLLRRFAIRVSRYDRASLAVIVFAIGVLQMLGDWGHAERFWSQACLLGLSVVGVLWGARSRSPSGSASEPA